MERTRLSNLVGLLLLLMANSVVARQDASFQISNSPAMPVATSGRALPLVRGALRVQYGRAYLAYVSADTVVKSGYLENGSWTQSVSMKVPYGLWLNTGFVPVIDEKLSVWTLHEDLTRHIRVTQFTGNQVQGIFNLADTHPQDNSPSAICSNYSGGIWFAASLSSHWAAGWFVDVNSPSHMVDLHVDDLQVPANNGSWSSIGLAVSTATDSLVAACDTYGDLWPGGNSHYYHTKTGLGFPTERKTVRLDSAEFISSTFQGNSGQSVANYGLGSTRNSVLAITEDLSQGFRSGPVTYYYFFYLVRHPDVSPNSPIRKCWPSFLQGPSRISMAVSQGTDLLALAWVVNDTICVRVLKDTIWCKTKQFVEQVSDGQRSILNVAVGPDSTVWVMYSALKNSQKHIFLAGVTADLDAESPATGIDDVRNDVPVSIRLDQNYPNPFNPSTTISFSLPKSVFVSLKIFNTLGQEIASLVNERREAGFYQATWNANVPSGLYFYRLQAGEYVETKKMILLR